ncbi:unnamed protein product [Arctogadus glacialis]
MAAFIDPDIANKEVNIKRKLPNEEILYGRNYSSVTDSFLQYVSKEERKILECALESFESVEKDDLLDVLEAHDCHHLASEETIAALVSQNIVSTDRFKGQAHFLWLNSVTTWCREYPPTTEQSSTPCTVLGPAWHVVGSTKSAQDILVQAKEANWKEYIPTATTGGTVMTSAIQDHRSAIQS